MKKLKLTRYSLTLLTALLFSGCSTVSTPSSTSSTSTSSTASAAAEKTVFSDLKELDFTPPQEEYRIGSGDLIDIRVFQAPELSQPTRVDPRGNISLPLIGSIKAEGMSQTELQKKLAVMLGEKYLQNPQITLFIQEFTNQRVTVEGEVKTAGVFPIKGDMTLLQSVALAGGLTSLADPSKTVLFRRQGNVMKAYNVDVDSIRAGTLRDPYLRNDDRIIVNRSSSRFWIREIGSLLTPFQTFLP